MFLDDVSHSVHMAGSLGSRSVTLVLGLTGVHIAFFIVSSMSLKKGS